MTDFLGRENVVKINPRSLSNFLQHSRLYGISANHSDSDKLSIIQHGLNRFLNNFLFTFECPLQLSTSDGKSIATYHSKHWKLHCELHILNNYFEDNVGFPKRNYIGRNIFVNAKLIDNGKTEWSYVGRNLSICNTDTFVDFKHQNFTLKHIFGSV